MSYTEISLRLQTCAVENIKWLIVKRHFSVFYNLMASDLIRIQECDVGHIE